MSKKPIEWICHINRSGYSQSCQEYLYAFRDLPEIDLRLTIINREPDRHFVSPARYNELIKLASKDYNKEAIQIFQCVPETQIRYVRNPITIGFGVFETFDPPQNWFDILNLNTRVFCPSGFNMKVFSPLNTPPLYLPHCFNPQEYNETVEPSERVDDVFTFMFVGTFRQRKGLPILLESFLKTFTKRDKVRLVIKTDKYLNAQSLIEDIKKDFDKDNMPDIILEGRVFNEKTMPSFMRNADCIVQPTMGEGFGLSGLYAMALGIPLITTDFSGCLDYADDSNSTLIRHSNYVVLNETDGIAQHQGKKWAYFTTDEVSKRLLEVWKNYDAAKAKAQVAIKNVNTRFTYSKVSELFLRHIEQL